MEHKKWMGRVSAATEFLFPDEKLAELPSSVRAATAENGKCGIQLLLRTGGERVQVSMKCGEELAWECYRMHSIPVEYNTGDGVEQGGGMVLTQPQPKCPSYAVRLAPFRVYDCLERTAGEVETQDGLAAIYVCIAPRVGLQPGEREPVLEVRSQEGIYTCRISLRIYGVRIPDGGFSVSNWFSMDAICRQHSVEYGTEIFWRTLDTYIAAMRRAEQTHFYLELDKRVLADRAALRFNFSALKPVISRFFEAGLETLEIGPILSRGFLKDGSPNMYTDAFTCMAAPEVAFESEEGYAITAAFLEALARFLGENGWEGRVAAHIHDEPDIHFRGEETLAARRRQYYQAVCMLKRYLPQARVIEAVDSTAFAGGIDIWVAGTAGYEKHKREFDRLSGFSEEIWNYVCCGPQGRWLNRFLDFALLKGRLLFWGFEENRVSGYLHWGLNQYPENMDPYQATSCPNPTGIGTAFPCGDAFVVYPGKEGARISMRLEAQRQGVEDYKLLRLLRESLPGEHDRLMAGIFRSNTDYEESPQVFEQAYEELLKALEDAGREREACGK